MNLFNFIRLKEIFNLATKSGSEVHSSVWSDITSELYVRGGANAPTATAFIGDILQYEMTSNQQKDTFSNFHINHDIATNNVGDKCYPHLHFGCKTSDSGNVLLQFEWVYAKGHSQEKFQSVSIVKNLVFPIPINSERTHFVAELPEVDAIPNSVLEPDALILMRVSRMGNDVSDTFPGSIWATAIDIHYLSNRAGTLFKSPPFNG